VRVLRCYPIDKVGPFTVEMPRNTRILSVQTLHGGAGMWALIDQSETVMWTFSFHCVLGGLDLPESCTIWKFIGSFTSNDEFQRPMHLFQEKP
jgi:hypothetical protein